MDVPGKENKRARETDEMFSFENEGDDLLKSTAATGNIHLTDSSDNESRIIDQFESTPNEGKIFNIQIY